MKNKIVVFAGEISNETMKEVLKLLSRHAKMEGSPELVTIAGKPEPKEKTKRGAYIWESSKRIFEISEKFTNAGYTLTAPWVAECLKNEFGVKKRIGTISQFFGYGVKKGYFARVSTGRFKLTPKGSELLKNARGEHEKTQA